MRRRKCSLNPHKDFRGGLCPGTPRGVQTRLCEEEGALWRPQAREALGLPLLFWG